MLIYKQPKTASLLFNCDQEPIAPRSLLAPKRWCYLILWLLKFRFGAIVWSFTSAGSACCAAGRPFRTRLLHTAACALYVCMQIRPDGAQKTHFRPKAKKNFFVLLSWTFYKNICITRLLYFLSFYFFQENVVESSALLLKSLKRLNFIILSVIIKKVNFMVYEIKRSFTFF